MEKLDITKIKRADILLANHLGMAPMLVWVINVLPGEKLEVYEYDSEKGEPIRRAVAKYIVGLDCVQSIESAWTKSTPESLANFGPSPLETLFERIKNRYPDIKVGENNPVYLTGTFDNGSIPLKSDYQAKFPEPTALKYIVDKKF